MSLGTLRSLYFLAALTFRRQLFARKTLLALLFFSFLAALVVFAGILRPWRVQDYGRWVALELLGSFFVPAVALAYGTGALGDDRDDKSLVYLLMRSIPRWGIYIAKYLAMAPLALLFTLGALLGLCELTRWSMGNRGVDLIGPLWMSVLLSTLAYLALFHLFAALFRHSTVIAVAYAFFIELFIGRWPGILKRISIRFYSNSLAFASTETWDLKAHRPEMKYYLPVSGETATWVLLGLTAVLLVLGAWIFARREYRDVA